MKITEKAELIRLINRLRPFELNDDPVLWRQSDTLDRVVDVINNFTNEEN